MKTIGVLLHRIDDDLARSLITGLTAKAEQYHLRLIFFPGRQLHSQQLFNRQFNVLFDLASRVPLDGVIAVTNAFQAGAYEDEIAQVFSLFQPTPLISLNFIARDNPSVIADNRHGAEQLFNHLIHSHGYRRIAYMRGATGHFDEEERFAAYVDALHKAAIPFDPELVVLGNFDPEAGARAMAELLARGRDFDVLVAANDQMALAALALANERNLHVPGDFAICGFDNFLSQQGEAPPLTTVAQPVALQAQMALELLLSHIEGNSIPLVTKVPLQLVIRQSCGCLGERLGNQLPAHARVLDSRHYRQKILTALAVPEARLNVYKSYLMFLEHCLLQVDKSTWMDVAIGEFAHECLVTEGDVSQLQTLVFYLQRHLQDICPSLRALPAPEYVLACAEQMQKWQMVIAAKLRHFQLQGQLQREHERELLSHFVKTHLSDFSLSSICELLQKTLRHLQVNNAVLGLYNHSFDYQLFGVDIPAELRLVLVMAQAKVQTELTDQLVPVSSLCSSRFFSEAQLQALVVLPIFQHNRHFGLLALDMSANPQIPLEWLRHEISSVLIGAILTEELQQQQHSLQRHLDITNHQNARLVSIAERDELTGLFNRRGFFHRAPVWISNNAGREILLLFIDLDDLKQINDNYGHLEGDAALISAAELISRVFRAEDLISRLSGDEFVVVSAGYAQHPVETLRQRLYEQFDRYNQESDKPYLLSCSLGYYPFESDDITPLEDIIAKADELLYEEKRRRKLERLN